MFHTYYFATKIADIFETCNFFAKKNKIFMLKSAKIEEICRFGLWQ